MAMLLEVTTLAIITRIIEVQAITNETQRYLDARNAPVSAIGNAWSSLRTGITRPVPMLSSGPSARARVG